MGEELTINEAAVDPLINQVLKADRVPQAAFAQLLQSAARVRANALDRAIAGEPEPAPADESKSNQGKGKKRKRPTQN